VVRHSSSTSDPSRSGTPVAGPAWVGTSSSDSSRSRPCTAKRRLIASWWAARNDTPQRPDSSTAGWNLVLRATHTSTSRGSSETEVNDEAVITSGVSPA
jgi:hypothetical protein